MSDFNQITRKSAVEFVDSGLRQYLLRVFNYMALGLCVTAAAAWAVLYTPAIGWFFNINEATQTVSYSALGWIITLAPLVMIFAFNAVLTRGSLFAVQAMFWGFSALMGASIAPVMLMYTSASVVRVFLITAATFGAMSLWGYSTKKDLTSIGSFLIMGLWGVIIASIVNIFLKSEGLYFALSYISVAIFVGLTAYDMQKIRASYEYSGGSADIVSRTAVSGALNLYLDFINLFLSLLRIMGDRR